MRPAHDVEQGRLVRLVALDRVHLARTRAWANDVHIARLMNRERSVTEAEHEAWFESIRRREDCAFFAVEVGEPAAHVGNVWLWAIEPRHRKAELRAVIGEQSSRGRGIGTDAIDQLCRYGFERLALHRIYAYVLAINPGARRAFERAGFALEGTLRDDRWTGDEFTDSYVLARLGR
jgi:RimJ/RimL family protein N-acetyltransferase